MRVWVTRAAPGAEATGERLRAMGHQPLVAPVLRVRALDAPPADLAGVGALAFTSRNGVRAFAALSGERGLPVFAVGGATARAATDAGFASVRSAEGDSLALAQLIAAARAAFSGEVLHAGAEDLAGDLVGELIRMGLAARLHPVYRTEPTPIPDAAAAALMARPVELDAVMVHSPRAARTLEGYRALLEAAPELDLVCISEAAALPLQRLNFRRMSIATLPNEGRMLNLMAS